MRILLRDLSPDTNYLYQLRAVSETQVSEWSQLFSFDTFTDQTVPAEVTGLTIISSDYSFIAQWNAVTTNSNATPLKDFKDYVVQIYAGSEIRTFYTTFTDYTLTYNQNIAMFGTYQADITIVVAARDIHGNVGLAATASISQPIMGPVTNLTWTTSGDSFIAEWDAPIGIESSSIMYYELSLTAGAVTKIVTTRSLTYTLSFDDNVNLFLSPQGVIDLSVVAVGLVGDRSTAATATASMPPPPNVTNLVAAAGYDQIVLNWDSVDIAAYYEVHMNTTYPFTATLGNLIARPSTNSLVWTSVAWTTDAFFQVFAVSKFGIPSVAPASTTTALRPKTSLSVDTTAPGAFSSSDITLTNYTSTSGPALQVSFPRHTNPDNDVSQYVIRYSTSSSGPWQYDYVPHDSSLSVITRVLPGLTPGVGYYVGVAVEDFSANRSAFTSALVYPKTVDGNTVAPAAVTGISSFEGFNSLTIYWTESSEADVKWGAGTYDIDIATDSGFTTGLRQAKVGAPAATFSGLTPNVTYYVRVRARNSSGTAGTWSSTHTNALGQPADDIPTNTLPADVLKANTAILSNLFINDDIPAGRTGSLQSTNYNSSTGVGFKLSSSGLDIQSGTINARALLIQDSVNIMPAHFSDMEHSTSFYTGLTAGTATGVGVVSTFAYFNTQSLGLTANGTIYLGSSTTDYNIAVESSTTYILSFYAKATGTASITPSVTTNIPATHNGSSNSLTTTFTRYSFSFTTGATATALVPWFTTSGGGTVYIDGIQLERQLGALTTPSRWKPPGVTKIDGGIIRTGSIQSSNLVSYDGVSAPTWSLNTQGGLVIADALVRGKLVVGVGTNTNVSTTGQTAGTNANTGIYSGNFGGTGAQWSITGNGAFTLKTGSGTQAVVLDTTGISANDGTSTVYNAGRPAGETFKVTSAGAFYLAGDIFAKSLNVQGATISGNATVTGTLTGGTITGALIQTASSGDRVALLGSAGPDSIQFYTQTGHGSPGYMRISGVGFGGVRRNDILISSGVAADSGQTNAFIELTSGTATTGGVAANDISTISTFSTKVSIDAATQVFISTPVIYQTLGVGGSSWAVPAGRIGGITPITSSQGSITTTVDLSGGSFTITLIAGRRYRFTAMGLGNSSTISTYGESYQYSVMLAGTQYAISRGVCSTVALSSWAINFEVSCVSSGATAPTSVNAGSTICKLQVARNGTGTQATSAGSTSPIFFWCEDIGT